ncbi:MAG: lamin tail domain-containing protein [Planctomycetes bacterium]|nr:lamin tail domain-containing protein [Planctomycetota bacterium]
MNMHKYATLILAAMLLAAPAWGQSPSGVVINEVFTGNPDWVEIANTSGTTRVLDGWQLQAVFGYTLYPAYVFPSGTSIAPGECLIVLENTGSLVSVINPPPPSAQILNTIFGYGWIGTSTGSLALVDQLGQVQDLLVFGTGPCLLPPSATALSFADPVDRFGNDPALGNVIYRASETDGDDGHDWQQGLNGSETPGQPNPGQDFGLPALHHLELVGGSCPLVFDPQHQSFTVTATIGGLALADGTIRSDPAWDPLIGGTITVTAPILGSASADLGGLISTQAQVDFTDGCGAMARVTGIIAAEGSLEQELIGPLGTWPVNHRALSTRGLVLTQTGGTASPALAAVTAAALGARLYFVIRLDDAGPRLVRVDLGRDPNAPAPGLSSRLAAAGQGALEIGVINASMNAVIFNVFVITPALPLGQGPVAGIDWGPSQWQQVFLPLPSPPFHVNPASPGQYHFSAPQGTVPPGIWLDHVAIQLIGGLPVFSPPTRAFF